MNATNGNEAKKGTTVRVHMRGQGFTDFRFKTNEEAERFAYLNWNPLICPAGQYEWAEVV